MSPPATTSPSAPRRRRASSASSDASRNASNASSRTTVDVPSDDVSPPDPSGPWSTDRGPRLRYLPGLDGLRALAVLAVLGYHGGIVGLPGGFLGVEVFLVISGYLITSLLVAERNATGGLNLRDFWVRRARRLLPAVGVLLVVVSVVSVIFLPDEVAGLRGDVLSALFYVQNWYQIFADQSYFAAVARPPLLRHLWSLAVEEQFYLVWPLVFALGIRLLGRRRLLVGVVAGAVASAVWMAVLFNPVVDPTRVYYGTDTRASGLLLGVALAMVWAPGRLRSNVTDGGRAVLDGVGVAALLGLGLLMATLGEFSTVLYRGGFLLTGVLSVVVIAVLVHPAARLGTALGIAPLRWIGLRSYGIYLWHWPVFMLTRPELDVSWPGWVVVAVRLGLTVGIAELSFRFVEMPVRHGALGRGWARLKAARSETDVAERNRVLVGGTVAMVGLLVLGAVMVRADEPGPPPWFVATTVGSGSAAETTGVLALLPSPLAAAILDRQAAQLAAEQAAGQTAGEPAPVMPEMVVGRVTLLGDSVMLGAVEQLGATLPGEVITDAAVSRQVVDGLSLLRLWRDIGYLGDTVVVHLGNNGVFTDQQFDEMMEILDGIPNVFVVNTRNTFGWQEGVNATLSRGAARYPNVELVDWHAASGPNGVWFWNDGMHLRPEGAQAYAALLAPRIPPPPPPTTTTTSTTSAPTPQVPRSTE